MPGQESKASCIHDGGDMGAEGAHGTRLFEIVEDRETSAASHVPFHPLGAVPVLVDQARHSGRFCPGPKPWMFTP
jgi:hypothetical protein